MTLESDKNKIQYKGNGSQTTFPYDYKIPSASEILVITEIDGVETVETNYSVTGAGDDNGGTVVFNTAPVDTTTITLKRDVHETQELDLVKGGKLPSNAIENSLDKLTMLVQDQSEYIDRSLKYPVSDPIIGAELPLQSERAEKLLGFDASGVPIVSDSTVAEVDATVAAAREDGTLITSDSFIGDGIEDEWEITATPINKYALLIQVGGVTQEPSTYDVTGNTVTFTEAPPISVPFTIRNLGYSVGALTGSASTISYVANGGTTRTVQDRLRTSFLLSDYDNIIDALGKIVNVGGGKLIIDIPFTLGNDLTIIEMVSLEWRPKALVSLGHYDLTINGSLEAGTYQIFNLSGTGFVKCKDNVSETQASWWGLIQEQTVAGSDNTTALQNAINSASYGSKRVRFPGGVYKYTRLYFHYDSTNNPNWDITDDRNPMVFDGAGSIQESFFNYTGNNDALGTILISTVTTGNCIIIGNTTGKLKAGKHQISNISFFGETTGYIVDVAYATNGFTLKQCFVGMKAGVAGTGINMEASWGSRLQHVFVKHGDLVGSPTTGSVGLRTHNDAGLGGGNTTLADVVIGYFDTDFDIASRNVYMLNCEDYYANTGLKTSDDRAENITIIGQYSEFNLGVHFDLQRGKNISIIGSRFIADNAFRDLPASQTAIRIGTVANTGGVNGVNIQSSLIEGIGRGGTSAIKRYNDSSNIKIEQVTFEVNANYLGAFTLGTSAIVIGDTVTGAVSGETAVVSDFAITSGSWVGGDAAGSIYVDLPSGTFQNEILNVVGVASATLTADFVADVSPNVIEVEEPDLSVVSQTDLIKMRQIEYDGIGQYVYDPTTVVGTMSNAMDGRLFCDIDKDGRVEYLPGGPVTTYPLDLKYYPLPKSIAVRSTSQLAFTLPEIASVGDTLELFIVPTSPNGRVKLLLSGTAKAKTIASGGLTGQPLNRLIMSDGARVDELSDSNDDIVIHGGNSQLVTIEYTYESSVYGNYWIVKTGPVSRRGTSSGIYDVSLDGGTAGTYAICQIPDNATVIKASYEVITTFTDGATDAATIALGVDINNPTGIEPTQAINSGTIWDIGYHDTDCDGLAANFTSKTSGVRDIIVTVGVATLTAGKLYLSIEWIVSE